MVDMLARNGVLLFNCGALPTVIPLGRLHSLMTVLKHSLLL